MIHLIENYSEVAMRQSQSDPVIDEIREVRHRISARFDHDPAQLVAYYMELQKQYQDRLIEPRKSSNALTRQLLYNWIQGRPSRRIFCNGVKVGNIEEICSYLWGLGRNVRDEGERHEQKENISMPYAKYTPLT